MYPIFVCFFLARFSFQIPILATSHSPFLLPTERPVDRASLLRQSSLSLQLQVTRHSQSDLSLCKYIKCFPSLRLETGVFAGRPADFLFMLIFNYICDEIVSLSLWYLWSQWFPHMMDPMVTPSCISGVRPTKNQSSTSCSGLSCLPSICPWSCLA